MPATKRSCEQPGAGHPGDERGPAEPEQRARRDVLGDAGATGTAFVGGGVRKARDLYGVEVVKEADPEHAGHDMHPARERQMVEFGIRHQRAVQAVGQHQRQDDARDECVAMIRQYFHCLNLPGERFEE